MSKDSKAKRRSYSEVVSESSASGSSSDEESTGRQNRVTPNWLLEYQTENEETALRKALSLSMQVSLPLIHIWFTFFINTLARKIILKNYWVALLQSGQIDDECSAGI